MKLNPKCEYAQLAEMVGQAGDDTMLVILRTLLPSHQCSDAELYDSIAELIHRRFLDVYVRRTSSGVEVQPEFLMPASNDNVS